MNVAFSSIRDPQISARRAKYAIIDNVNQADGKNKIILGNKKNPCKTPFGASTFNGDDAKRKCIEFVGTPEEEEQINDFYNWVLDYLQNNSDRFFKKAVAADGLKEILKNPIVKKEPYQARIKCKIDTSGNSAVKCWDADGQRCELPFDLRGQKLIPKINFNHIWFMSKECGFVFLGTDIQILDSDNESCPFE